MDHFSLFSEISRDFCEFALCKVDQWLRSVGQEGALGLEENSPTGAIFLQLQLSFVFLQSDGGQAKNYTKKLFVGEALPILVAHITVMRLGATTTIIL